MIGLRAGKQADESGKGRTVWKVQVITPLDSDLASDR